MNFCNDSDLLKYEPSLFGNAHFPNQVIASGSGASISGSYLAKAGSEFTSGCIKPGQVIWVSDGQFEKCYEILSIDSASQLRISVLRESDSSPAISPAPAVNLNYRVCTYGPQISQTSSLLCRYFGLGYDNDFADSDIKDPQALKPACIFGVLSSLYATLANGNESDSHHWQKSAHYYKLFERAREQSHALIDSDNDGLTEVTLGAKNAQLRRA